MKKIAVIGMTNNPGGVETYLMNFFFAMRKDYKIIFINISPNNKISYQRSILSHGGQVFVADHQYSLKSYFFRTRIAKKILVKVNADIVYVNALTVNSAYWVKAAKSLKIPAVYHSHNDAYHGSKVKRIISSVLKPYNQKILKYAKHLSVSKAASKFMFNNASATIVYNSIELNRWRFNQNDRMFVRNELKYNNDEKIIIIVARLSEQKNILRAMNIIRKIVDLDNSYRCIVVGDGNLRNEVVKRIKKLNLEKYVKLLGTRNDIPKLMSGSDVLLLPSLFEGLPFVVIEAQGSGLPVVTSKDVVPSIANVTKSILEISLERSDESWAKEIVNVKSNSLKRRNEMNDEMENSFFSNKYYEKRIKSLFGNL